MSSRRTVDSRDQWSVAERDPDDVPDEGEYLPAEEKEGEEEKEEFEFGSPPDEVGPLTALPSPEVPGRSRTLEWMPGAEKGLSVEPEDLAVDWLNGATDQGNFESGEDADEFGMTIVHVRGLSNPVPGGSDFA